MANFKNIIIAGAGPGGASAAIRLAKKGFRVSLIEREKFPRQKLCGEFVSPECLAYFRELGVEDRLTAIGGEKILKTIFYESRGSSFEIPSAWFDDGAALGISRAAMDFALLERAREVGVEVFEQMQISGIERHENRIVALVAKTNDGVSREFRGNFFVDATGRARVLSKLYEKTGETKSTNRKILKSKYVAFKAHFQNTILARDACEIYLFRGGYGGLNYVEGGAANHCFIIQSDVAREFAGDADAIFREVILKNSRARETMRDATKLFEWLAVAIDEFGFKNSLTAENLVPVGDAGAFIDPFTGSGILMALESSELLESAFLESRDLPGISKTYSALHAEKFRTRIRVCNLWRNVAFSSAFTAFGTRILGNRLFPRRFLAQSTRSNFAFQHPKWTS